jgi:hypothetical protein
MPFSASVTLMTFSMIIRNILLGHCVTRSCISVFHSDLHTIQRSLDLHAIPHANMTLVQCWHALLHHITHHWGLHRSYS